MSKVNIAESSMCRCASQPSSAACQESGVDPMKTVASHWIAMLCAIVCLLVSGCAGVITPNSWTFQKSNVRCHAWTNCFGAFPRYDMVKIGSLEEPFFKSPPRFSIRLADGRMLLSTEFSLETIRGIGKQRLTKRDNWPKESVDFSTPRFAFVFLDGRLVVFEARECLDKAGMKQVPAIGTYDKSHFYEMPLTHEQLIEIFGKPDFVKKDRFE